MSPVRRRLTYMHNDTKTPDQDLAAFLAGYLDTGPAVAGATLESRLQEAIAAYRTHEIEMAAGTWDEPVDGPVPATFRPQAPRLPSDWRCPSCRTRKATVAAHDVVCENGHHSM